MNKTHRKLFIWATSFSLAGVILIALGIFGAIHLLNNTQFGLFVGRDLVSSETLVRHLEGSDPDMVMTALGILAERRDVSARDSAIHLLDDPDTYIWLNSVLYLGAIQEPIATPHLIRALRHRAWRAHGEIAQHLTNLTGQHYGTDQELWIEWWQRQHPQSTYDFGFDNYRQQAVSLQQRSFDAGGSIMVMGVVDALTLEHSGAKIRLAGLRLVPNATEAQAIQLLEDLVLYEFVALESAQDLYADDTVLAIVYAGVHPSDGSESRLRQSRGLSPSPLRTRTALQSHLIQSGLYEADPQSIPDLELRDAFVASLPVPSP